MPILATVAEVGVVAQSGRRSSSMVACQTVVLQSQVRIRCLPSPQLTANLLVGCLFGWHLAAGWPLWGATEVKITKMNHWFAKNTYKEKKTFAEHQSSRAFVRNENTAWIVSGILKYHFRQKIYKWIFGPLGRQTFYFFRLDDIRN